MYSSHRSDSYPARPISRYTKIVGMMTIKLSTTSDRARSSLTRRCSTRYPKKPLYTHATTHAASTAVRPGRALPCSSTDAATSSAIAGRTIRKLRSIARLPLSRNESKRAQTACTGLRRSRPGTSIAPISGFRAFIEGMVGTVRNVLIALGGCLHPQPSHNPLAALLTPSIRCVAPLTGD